MTHPPQPPFLMYVMWHSDSDDASSVAERVREHFQSPRFRHTAGAEPLEVFFHGARTPGAPHVEVAWDAACPIAVVVLIDRLLADNSEWVEYVATLADRAEAEGLRVRLVPVVMDPSALDAFPLAQQAIEADC